MQPMHTSNGGTKLVPKDYAHPAGMQSARMRMLAHACVYPLAAQTSLTSSALRAALILSATYCNNIGGWSCVIMCHVEM
eukprot:6175069-Pleurochrysis_carterae.AAC.2